MGVSQPSERVPAQALSLMRPLTALVRRLVAWGFLISIDFRIGGSHNSAIHTGSHTADASSARKNHSLCEADMTQRTFSLITAALFSLISFLHAVRILRGWQVTIEGAVVPIWISWIGLAIAAYLAYEGFRLAKPKTK